MRVGAAGVVGSLQPVTFAVAGCGGTGDDRAGGKGSTKAVTLTLANPLPQPDELRPFVDEVERISDGKIEVRFRNEWLGWPWRRTEAALIRDVAAGKADLGWVGSRAWDDVGVTSFDALHAPLAVESYELQGEVLEAGIADELLEGVEPLGLVGLGVLPGPLRKVLGVERPFLRPADFDGMRVGLNRSQVGSASLRALGAVPVTVPGGVELGRAGRRPRAAGRVDRRQHIRRRGEVPDRERQPLAALGRRLHERRALRAARRARSGTRSARPFETATPMMLAAAEGELRRRRQRRSASGG